MMDPIAVTWLNVLVVGLLFGFAFTVGAFIANALLNTFRRSRA